MFLAFFAIGWGGDQAIIGIIFWSIIIYAVWLIVIGRYIYPSKNAKDIAIRTYFPLSINNYIQVFFVIIHVLIYLGLLGWLVISVFFRPVGGMDGYKFIIISTSYAVAGAAGVAMLSSVAYFLKIIFVITPSIFGLIILIITNPKAAWAAMPRRKTEEEKLNELLKKHNITHNEPTRCDGSSKEKRPNPISQSYYSNNQNSVSEPSNVPFWATFSGSIKILVNIPKTILSPRIKKPTKTHYGKPKK